MLELPKWLLSWGHFIKVHERLLIIVLAAFLLFRGGQGLENMYIRSLDKKSSESALIVKSDDQRNAALDARVAQTQADNDREFATLKADMKAATEALKAKQQQDAVATPQQIDDRLIALLKLQPGTVKSDTNTTQLSNDAANQLTQELEQIPALQIQVKDLTTELASDEKLIAVQQESITGFKQELQDEKKSHADDVNLVKAQGKRSWIKGFKIGLIVGAVGGEAIRVMLGKP